MVSELIPVLGSQPAGDVSHKPGGRLPLLSVRPAVTLATLKCCYQFCWLVNRGTMGVNSLPKTVTRQRRGCDFNPGPSAPESSTLTTRLPSFSSIIRRYFIPCLGSCDWVAVCRRLLKSYSVELTVHHGGDIFRRDAAAGSGRTA